VANRWVVEAAGNSIAIVVAGSTANASAVVGTVEVGVVAKGEN
jgi:hypothetical protein